MTIHRLQAPDPGPTLPWREFAARIGAPERTVRYWIDRRTVDVVKIGRRVRIPVYEIERIAREGFRPAVGRQNAPNFLKAGGEHGWT